MVIWSSLRNIHKTSEINITFGFEMWPGKRIACILENIFVKIFILSFSDFTLGFEPKRFVFVKSFIFIIPSLLCSSSINWVFNIFFSELFSFFLPFFLQLFVLFFKLFVWFLNFFFIKVFLSQINWIVNKWGISLDEFF